MAERRLSGGFCDALAFKAMLIERAGILGFSCTGAPLCRHKFRVWNLARQYAVACLLASYACGASTSFDAQIECRNLPDASTHRRLYPGRCRATLPEVLRMRKVSTFLSRHDLQVTVTHVGQSVRSAIISCSKNERVRRSGFQPETTCVQ
jgi:hypothetical protein